MNTMEFSGYVPLCEQYNGLAQSFYRQYLDAKEQKRDAICLLQSAICAVVFQAFSIEAYVNFFGAYTLGDKSFYETYESGERGKRYSTIEKMKLLCKGEGKNSYPTDGKHFSNLKGLLSKRDKLAHSKPRAHTLYKDDSSNSDYLDMMSEISFVYNNLDEEMKLYAEVKSNMSAACNVVEPIADMLCRSAKVMNALVMEVFTGTSQPEV